MAKKVIDRLDELSGTPARELFTFPNGVKVAIRQVGYYLVAERLRLIRPPEVPVQLIADKGRYEPNPDHPDYIKAVEAYAVERGHATADIYIGLGTKLVFCPKEIPGPDSPEWVKELEAVGLEIATDGIKRYIAWVKLIAARGIPGEISRLMDAITDLNAVQEDDVADAAESFRGAEKR